MPCICLRRISARAVLGALVLALISCAAVSGQSNFATLTGRVADPSGAPVSGALIAVRAHATGAVRTTASNSDGIYQLPNLLPGEYSVELSYTGFSPLTRQVTLEVGQTMGLDLALALGEKRSEEHTSEL